MPDWFSWIYFLLGCFSGVVIIILGRLAGRGRARAILKPLAVITAEEVTGMRIEAAKQSLSRLLETEDFKKLLLLEKIYLVINHYPLSGPNGNFNIGPKASA